MLQMLDARLGPVTLSCCCCSLPSFPPFPLLPDDFKGGGGAIFWRFKYSKYCCCELGLLADGLVRALLFEGTTAEDESDDMARSVCGASCGRARVGRTALRFTIVG